MVSSLESQLNELYAEKRMLFMNLGVSDAPSLIAMVQSLESQLNLATEASCLGHVANDSSDTPAH